MANRGSISTGGYEIDNSCKFEADNSEQLYRTPSSDGNMKTWTYSVWFKRTELGTGMTLISALDTYMYFETDDTAWLNIRSASTNFFMATNRKFRDTSAWYHAVIVCDLTDGTAADRLKLYINGVRETSFSNNTYENADSDDNTGMHKATVHRIGQYSGYGNKFCGYMAEINSIDGQALAPTEFGEFDENSGIWKPKEYTGSYGTNGFYLDFADAADLGDDESGNGNDWTEGGITSADQATDTPTNNFCTLLGQQQDSVTGTEPSIKEGGTTMFGGATSSQNAVGTMGVRSGKWYFESTITNSGGVSTENHNFGVVAADQITALSTGGGNDLGYVSGGWACASNSSPRNNNAAASGANATSALAVDKIMGCAVDMDNGKIWWHNEGTWHSLNSTVGNPANGTTPAFSNLLTATDEHLLPAGGFYINDNNQVRVMNFGGYAQAVFTAVGTYADANGYGSFAYQPPSGFYAICTKNLAEYG